MDLIDHATLGITFFRPMFMHRSRTRGFAKVRFRTASHEISPLFLAVGWLGEQPNPCWECKFGAPLKSIMLCIGRCYALRTVIAPGCKQFGIKVFEECCSLMQIGTNRETTNQLAPQAQLMPRAFEKCTALQHHPDHDSSGNSRCLPECCFLEAGTLPPDFTGIGPAACERCLQLQRVDLSCTEARAIIRSLHSMFGLLAMDEAGKPTSHRSDGSKGSGSAPGDFQRVRVEKAPLKGVRRDVAVCDEDGTWWTWTEPDQVENVAVEDDACHKTVEDIDEKVLVLSGLLPCVDCWSGSDAVRGLPWLVCNLYCNSFSTRPR